MKIVAVVLFSSALVFSEASASSLRWPMLNSRIVQGFGVTEFVLVHPNFYRDGEHLAIDLDEKFGAPVFSAASGTIIGKGIEHCPNYSHPDCNFGYGNWLLIWHTELNLATTYQHLAEAPRHEVGELVNAGDLLGYQGASGKVIGSHLHFAVFEGPIKVYEPIDGNVDFQVLGREKVKNPLTLLPGPDNVDKDEKEKRITEELARDLSELNKSVIQLQLFLEKLTPEERRKLCKNLQEKTEKNQPSISIIFECD